MGMGGTLTSDSREPLRCSRLRLLELSGLRRRESRNMMAGAPNDDDDDDDGSDDDDDDLGRHAHDVFFCVL
jgi:hypothetical protein